MVLPAICTRIVPFCLKKKWTLTQRVNEAKQSTDAKLLKLQQESTTEVDEKLRKLKEELQQDSIFCLW